MQNNMTEVENKQKSNLNSNLLFNPLVDSPNQIFPDRRTITQGYLVSSQDKQELVELEQEDLQLLLPQDIFLNLPRLDREDCSLILKRSSSDQFQRFIDYDTWRSDKFESSLLLDWLECLSIDDDHGHHVFSKFSVLDEEYQILFMKDYFSAIDFELYENLDSRSQDKFIAFPGQQIYYSIHADSVDEAQNVQKIFQLLVANNVPYMMNLLLNAHSNIRNEVELQQMQFRSARIEEDGFVTNETARKLLQPYRGLSSDSITAKKENLLKNNYYESDALIESNKSYEETKFLKNSLEELSKSDSEASLTLLQQFYHLNNAVCSAMNVKPEQKDMVSKIISHVEGVLNIGLEFISEADLQSSVQALKTTHLKSVFKIGLAVIENAQLELLKEISAIDQGQVRKLIILSKFQQVHNELNNSISIEALSLPAQQMIFSIFYQLPLCVDLSTYDGEKIHFSSIQNITQLNTMVQILKYMLQHTKVNDSTKVKFDQFVSDLSISLNIPNQKISHLKKLYSLYKGMIS